jgi:hypothetical protein
MRTTMKMSDLKYKAGFPVNIDRNSLVIVQIQTGQKQGIILYTCKERGVQDRCYLPLELNKVYAEKLYVIRP